jgi:hypothetical protein
VHSARHISTLKSNQNTGISPDKQDYNKQMQDKLRELKAQKALMKAQLKTKEQMILDK